jgi:hypothetical protein
MPLILVPRWRLLAAFATLVDSADDKKRASLMALVETPSWRLKRYAVIGINIW